MNKIIQLDQEELSTISGGCIVTACIATATVVATSAITIIYLLNRTFYRLGMNMAAGTGDRPFHTITSD